MSNFDDMNVETQLQVAYSANAQLRDQIDALNRTVWSLEERLVSTQLLFCSYKN